MPFFSGHFARDLSRYRTSIAFERVAEQGDTDWTAGVTSFIMILVIDGMAIV
jgi:hypothetical protein